MLNKELDFLNDFFLFIDSVESIRFHWGTWVELLLDIGAGGRLRLLLLLNLFNGLLRDEINPRFFFLVFNSWEFRFLVASKLLKSDIKSFGLSLNDSAEGSRFIVWEDLKNFKFHIEVTKYFIIKIFISMVLACIWLPVIWKWWRKRIGEWWCNGNNFKKICFTLTLL